jgi:hypothetical protein
MRGVLRAEPLWVETFTGLRMRQFERLLKVVRERGGNGPGGGRPWCLPLADWVLLVAVYYRTNLRNRRNGSLPVTKFLAGARFSLIGQPAGPERRRQGLLAQHRAHTVAYLTARALLFS